MRWANTRTDTGSLSCSLWAQGVSVPRHWGQPEALLCAQFPPKGQTAFLLGVMFPKVTVWHEPNLPTWGQAPDPGEDAATKKHHGQNEAPVTPGGCGWGGAWPCPGHSGQLTPCLGVLGPLLPLASPPLRDPPPGEALHEGITGTGVSAEITADCGVCKQKIEWPGVSHNW